MRAARFHSFGAPDVLVIEDVDRPQPGPGEALVRIRAAAIQPFDSRVRSGRLMPNLTLPVTTGNEFAGMVESLGPETAGPAAGTPVAGRRTFGAVAEYVVVPVGDLAVIPAGVSFAEAATLSGTAQTADTAVESLGIGVGDTLLIQGAAGGIGSFATQLAIARGARVIGTGSPANIDYLRALGATPLTPGPDLPRRIAEVAPDGLTAILDCVGGETLDQSLTLGVPRDRIASLGDLGRVAELGLRSVEGLRDGVRLARLLDLAAQGKLLATVRSTYPINDIVAAHRELDTGHGRGKIVIAID
ncbi:NADP-dependent oxidoreductase [Devosia sp. XK-2]|uniref:NADP-dependent oxidoreductase n=1 Tax=Devosia sp. XK-2 TaxID=3126689 RepID=UPI0030CA8C8C